MISSDIKDYYDPGYLLQRVLACDNIEYAEFLQHNIEHKSAIDGAIFMPEHLLALKNKELFIVTVKEETFKFNVNINISRRAISLTYNTIAELERIEENNDPLTKSGFGATELRNVIIFDNIRKAKKLMTNLVGDL